MDDNLKDVKELLSFGFGLTGAVISSLADGRVGITDLSHLLPVLPKLGPAIEGAHKIPGSLRDMTDEDCKKLCDWAKAEFNLVNDELEAKIEIVLQMVMQLIAGLNKFLAKG